MLSIVYQQTVLHTCPTESLDGAIRGILQPRRELLNHLLVKAFPTHVTC